ncbi:MAG: YggT family protein [Candidatus Methanomethyliaceae archaeon]
MLDLLLKSIVQVIDLFLTIYIWIIIARAIISWINPYPYHPIVNFLYKITEPILSPLRKIIPPIGGIDFTPIIVILGIYFLKNLLQYLVFG